MTALARYFVHFVTMHVRVNYITFNAFSCYHFTHIPSSYKRKKNIRFCFSLQKLKAWIITSISNFILKKCSSIQIKHNFNIKLKNYGVFWGVKMIGTINNQYETRIINHSSIKLGLNNQANIDENATQPQGSTWESLWSFLTRRHWIDINAQVLREH